VSGGDVVVSADPPGSRKYFTIGDEGRLVVYAADQETDGVVELYAARIDGSTSPVKLSDPTAGRKVETYRLDPSGFVLVYRTERSVTYFEREYELFRVPIRGAFDPERLVGGSSIFLDIEIAPHANHVLFLADRDTAGVTELYSSRMSRLPRSVHQIPEPTRTGVP
jgi:hypothetical protein